MHRAITIGSILLLLAAVLGGCTTPKCWADGVDCFLDHMVMVEPKEGGEPFALVELRTSPFSSSSSSTPPEGAPSITTEPKSFEINGASELSPLTFAWENPSGCTPTFCARVCLEERCSTGLRCTPLTDAGSGQGTFETYVGFLAEPRDKGAPLTLGITPVSASGCPSDLVDRLAGLDASGALVGAELRIDVMIFRDEGEQ
jgi:hypothetical protein